jgi:hypothetical protein
VLCAFKPPAQTVAAPSGAVQTATFAGHLQSLLAAMRKSNAWAILRCDAGCMPVYDVVGTARPTGCRPRTRVGASTTPRLLQPGARLRACCSARSAPTPPALRPLARPPLVTRHRNARAFAHQRQRLSVRNACAPRRRVVSWRSSCSPRRPAAARRSCRSGHPGACPLILGFSRLSFPLSLGQSQNPEIGSTRCCLRSKQQESSTWVGCLFG